MKIQVIGDRSKEPKRITLLPPITIHEGEELNRITSGNGIDYFFTKDGLLDGWGGNLVDIDIEEEEALAFAEQVSRDQEVKPAADPEPEIVN